jgi:1,4-dihydroxy-2-naphthoate octaprenyltransferase
MRDEASDRKSNKNTIVVKLVKLKYTITFDCNGYGFGVDFAIIDDFTLINTCFIGLYPFNKHLITFIKSKR